MPEIKARCTNFGNCPKADRREIITIPSGGDLICPVPDCRQPLTVVQSGGGPGGGRKILIAAGGLVFLLLLVLIGRALLGRHGKAIDVNGMSGQLPSPSQPALPPQSQATLPILSTNLELLYERTLEAWFKDFGQKINQQSNGKGHLKIANYGSREGFHAILYGKETPALWDPADLYWTDKLKRSWQDPRFGKQPYPIFAGPDSVKVLTTTCLVLVMHPDRARVFEAAQARAPYRGETWSLLRDIATKGWKAIGGEKSWGKLKLIHTDPTKSNSGTCTLALMFAEYKKDHPAVTADSPTFLSFMQDIERSVVSFPRTTSIVSDALAGKGGNAADIGVTYEVNAMSLVDKVGGFTVVYPAPTKAINFPIALLNGSWLTPQQKSDARNTMDYLLSDEVQEQFIKLGFRSINPTKFRDEVDQQLTAGDRAGAGFRLDVDLVDRSADVPTIDALQYEWNARFGHP